MALSYLQKLRGIFFTPLDTLEELKSEEGMNSPFWFWFISSAIAGLIAILFQLARFPIVILFKLFILRVVIYAIPFSFLLAGVIHSVVFLLGGRNPFYQSYKAFAYISAFGIVYELLNGLRSFVPSYISTAIFIVNLSIVIWALVLLNSAFKYYIDLSGWKMAVLTIILLILWIVVIVVKVFWLV